MCSPGITLKLVASYSLLMADSVQSRYSRPPPPAYGLTVQSPGTGGGCTFCTLADSIMTRRKRIDLDMVLVVMMGELLWLLLIMLLLCLLLLFV